jgi:hypothetical protein
VRAFGILSALALGLTLAAPTMAARYHGRHLDHPGPIRPVIGLQSSGEISAVLSSEQFILAMAGGDDLAVNMTAKTTIVNDMTTAGATAGSSAAVPATGEYATVSYHFDAADGAVASRVVLSTSPLPSGPARQVRGMITAVGTGEFTLETAAGVSFTIDTLATTRMRWVEAGPTAGSSTTTMPALAVGDFADVTMRSAGAVDDASAVTYSNAPVGVRNRRTLIATVNAVSGSVLTLSLANGGSLDVTVLPGASVLLNGQAASVTEIVAGDHVRLQGVEFLGVEYATSLVVTSSASQG